MLIPVLIYFTLPILIGILLMKKMNAYKNYHFFHQFAFLCFIMVSLFLDFEITSTWNFDDYLLMLFLPLLISYLAGLVYLYVKNKK